MISIALACDSSYAAVSRNFEDFAELKISAKECQRITIRIRNERIEVRTRHNREAFKSGSLERRSTSPVESTPKQFNKRIKEPKSSGGMTR